MSHLSGPHKLTIIIVRFYYLPNEHLPLMILTSTHFISFFFLPMSFSQFLQVGIYFSEAIIYENYLNEIYQHISYFYTKNKTTFKWMFRSINVINALLEITLTLVQNSNDKYTFPPNIMFCTNRLMYATIHDTTYPIRLMLPVTLNA